MCGCCKIWLVLLLVQYTQCTQEPEAQLVVRTDPPGPVYSAATWILFTCKVEGHPNPASLQYEWHGSDPNGRMQLLSDDPNLDGDRSATLWYLSTYEFQYIHCLVFNESKFIVAEDVLLNVTGVGVHLKEVFLASIENSTSIINPIQYDPNDNPLTLLCQSASRDPCASGHWIDPNSTPISLTPNQSCNSTSEQAFITTQFSITPELLSGLYSCVIPDKEKELRTLYIGIYNNLEERVMPFRSDLVMTHQVDRNHLILNCMTRQLPSYTAKWEQDRIIINTSRPALLDAVNAEYSTSIEMYWNSNGAVILSCLVYTEWIYPEPYFVHEGASANGNFIIAELGSSRTIICTALNGMAIDWLDSNREPLVSTGLNIQGGAIIITNITGGLHNLKFQCVGRDSTGNIRVWNHYTIIVSVPADIVMVTLIGNTSEPAVVGDPHNITCCYALEATLPIRTLEWYHDGDKIEVGSGFNITISEQCSTLTIKRVGEVHRGSRYSCQVEWSPSLLLMGNTTSHIAEIELNVEEPIDLTTSTDMTPQPTSAAERPLSLVHLFTFTLLLSTLIINH